MYHYIYKTICKSGKFYIGRHSSKFENDNYYGSGKWIRSIKDKSSLQKIILEYCDEDKLFDLEETYIKKFIDNPLCMNFNEKSIGFSSKNNPNKTEEGRKRSSEFMKNNNPSKNKNSLSKMIESRSKNPSKLLGRKMPEEQKRKISIGKSNSKMTLDGKKKLSESRKKFYAEGKTNLPNMTGFIHSEETKLKMGLSRKNTKKIECLHCKGVFAPNIISRFHGNNCKLKEQTC